MPASTEHPHPDDAFSVHVDPEELLRRQLTADSDPPAERGDRSQRAGRASRRDTSTGVRGRSASTRSTRSYAVRRH